MRVEPREPEAAEEEVRATSAWRTVLIAVLVVWAGYRLGLAAAVMILALVVIIFLHELGHYLTARWAGMKVTEFFIGFGPRLWSFHRGETEYGLKAIPAGAYVKIIGMSNLEEVDAADEARTYRSKPYWRRLSVAVAGSTVHFILAFVLIVATFAGFGLRDPDSSRWTVFAVTEESAADDAGLRPDDRITAVDGREFGSFEEMSDYLRENPGKAVTLEVLRGGEQLRLEATLGSENPNTGERVGFLGIGPTYPRVRMGPVEAAGEGAVEFGRVAKGSVIGLGKLFSPSGISGYVDTVVSRDDGTTAPGEVNENRPTSVVGIVQVGSQIADDGWVNILYLLFAVNVFIGIFNLLPVLPFDGGHVAIATYEKVRSMISGRRYQADVAKLLPVAYVVVAVLALLFVTSIYLDIADPISVR